VSALAKAQLPTLLVLHFLDARSDWWLYGGSNAHAPKSSSKHTDSECNVRTGQYYTQMIVNVSSLNCSLLLFLAAGTSQLWCQSAVSKAPAAAAAQL
jgi:hypothetical protein